MSTRNLQYLFAPRSVAVIGASDRPHTVGATVMRNLLNGGFGGPIWPVNIRRATVAGRPAYRTIADLGETPDLAVICTPAPTVPAVIAELGARGTRGAIVVSDGLRACDAKGNTLNQAMLDAAKPFLLRILGPNCVGLLVPQLGLNASFAHTDALSGHLAFIAQSGALTTAMLDWARGMRIGFSHFVSLGNAADVDFGDLLDYFGEDRHTHAILLYIESVTHARKFMSAARAAARNKPVIVVKAGRATESAKAAASHTGALLGADDVYDAAFRRAGMLRVNTTRELFDAVETLARLKPLSGERLAIISNGGGPAVMATDALIAGGGLLSNLMPATLTTLNSILPVNWSRANPIDIVGDAPAERYAATLDAVLEDPNVDAALLIHAPTAIVPSTDIATACIPRLKASRCPVLTSWMGGEAVREAEASCAAAGIPTYSTPEEAISGFLQAMHYRRNQQQLMEVPASIPESFEPKRDEARAIIAGALAAGRTTLMEPEAKQLLLAYGVPVVETRIAHTVAELREVAVGLEFPLALKILSPDISHKSDVGGVALDIATVEALELAAQQMLARCRERVPSAQLLGFTLQPMVRRPHAHELIVGLAVDSTFGPIALFGQGGTAVEVIADKAVGLLPLNMALARELIARTRVQRLLAGFRDRPPINRCALERTLVQLSQLAVDLAEIVELDVNPLLADESGVFALDARVCIARATGNGTDRMAIRPYPTELEEPIELDGRHILLRPIRPEDFPQYQSFLAQITAEDLHSRFFRAVQHLTAAELARFTQIDYERVMAFVAVGANEHGAVEILGVARAHADPDKVAAEFAILVRSDFKNRGLGSALLRKVIRYCRAEGMHRLFGDVLADNSPMLRLAQSCDFRAKSPREGCIHVTLDLRRPT